MFDGSSGFSLMPLKMSGRAINTIDELMVAISMPNVVLDNAIHLCGAEVGQRPGTSGP